MPTLIFLFTNPPDFDLPNGLIGWLGWFALLGGIVLLLRRWRKYNQAWGKGGRWVLLALLALVLLTSLLTPGIRLESGVALPPPLTPREFSAPAMMVLAALPWMLAAGLLGPAPAAGLAAFSGFLLAYWDTHSPFLPLEMAFLAACMGAAMQQRYRTRFYRLLRQPLFAAVLLGLIYLALFLIDTLFVAQGMLANRLDYALTHVDLAAFSIGGSLLTSAFLAEIIALAFPAHWGNKHPLRPSPAESRLAARFLYGMAPLALLLVFALMLGNWWVAGKVARQMLQERMANAADMSAQVVPFLLETGQSLITQLADDPRLYTLPDDEIREVLSNDLRTIPFFNQLFLLDARGESRVGYPQDDANPFLSPEERAGIRSALNGVPIQYFTAPGEKGSETALLSYVAVVVDHEDILRGVLVGRSNLAVNPPAQPLLTSLESLEAIGGEGILLDEDGHILVHPDPAQTMTDYTGEMAARPSFYDDTAPDGTRRIGYVQPVVGHPWTVVLTMPARYVQQQALDIATPLLIIIAVLFGVAVLLIRFGLRVVTASLDNLSNEAGRMARGQLDQPLRFAGEDEVGQLRRAFEQMRTGLKARLDELNRLLLVSQGVASTLEIEAAMRPVLESALITGAASARVVLAPAIMPEMNGDARSSLRFGMGPASDLYHDLDEQILSLTRGQERLMLTNPARPRLLVFAPGYPRPEAILSLALRHENLFYGALWVAYDETHQFSEEETRYLTTLAGQATLAIANARLFLTAEIGRQRLEAILSSTPDPVLVTDPQNRLLLANPAAWQVFGLGVEAVQGQPIERMISQQSLLELLRSAADERQSIEIKMPNGRVYLATASSVMSEERRLGRVCVLRDVTYFKELDSLKSEFVSTVSHDLRSPLTLIRGYATMLQMVGDLNEQQNNHVRKIILGVENMSRLVNNLLDLGRIEAGVGLQLEMTPLQDIIERVTGDLQLQANQKHITLSADLPRQTIPLVEADQTLLQQALHNLIENAIKYTGSGGTVQVGLRIRRDQAIFEVKDNGVGIAPADQPRLFEKFYRVGKKGEKKEGGSGLGLAIVKSIAERHSGQVWLESQLGKGSTFYLSIPLRQPKRKT